MVLSGAMIIYLHMRHDTHSALNEEGVCCVKGRKGGEEKRKVIDLNLIKRLRLWTLCSP